MTVQRHQPVIIAGPLPLAHLAITLTDGVGGLEALVRSDGAPADRPSIINLFVDPDTPGQLRALADAMDAALSRAA